MLSTFILFISLSSQQGFNKDLVLNDYQIKDLCKKERKKITCIKDYKNKRLNYLKGNRIEIPVIPFKR